MTSRTKPDVEIRLATLRDVAPLETLAKRSIVALGKDYYSGRQIDKAIDEIADIDTALIEDGTFYVAVVSERIVGCGAWSRCRRLVSGPAASGLPPDVVRAKKGSAVLRCFFVHPDYARQGVAAALFRQCRTAAGKCGYGRLEVLASATARRAFMRFGFSEPEPIRLCFDDGIDLASYRMTLAI